MKAYFLDVLKELPQYRPDLIVKEVNIDQGHIHLLISMPPTEPVESVMRLLKANTSKALNAKFPSLRQTIRRYIENQGKEDTGQNNVELF